jgi:D-beta-D-heptose 7-phosphate kinase/D-beta-D-heptose 1-phosphate adenosyltransferase
MFSTKRCHEILALVAGRRVLVVGDLMLDKYVYGNVSRISPEAPVPVVQVTRERNSPGGAANVGLNIQSLGGQAVLAGVVGRDHVGEELAGVLAAAGILNDGVQVSEGLRTTVKTRVVAERQQVVRIDHEDPAEAFATAVAALVRRLPELVRSCAAVIMEDYGKGVITQEIVDVVLASARAAGVPVGLDPKNNELRFSGITLATPNYKEACAAAGLREVPLSGDLVSHANLAQVGRLLMKKWTPEYLDITLGPYGMYLLSHDAAPEVIPTQAREVFDVSGAGDTVIAAAMLALAGRTSFHEAARMANVAAGVVVGKLGTATCSPGELMSAVAASGASQTD